MITIENFSYIYPGETKPSLRNIDLEIPEGQFCGVVGPNEAGKSTLGFALTGFIPHFFRGQTRGAILIDGKETASSSLGELAGEVGLVFQNPFNQISGARFTVREEIAFGLENLGLPRPEIKQRVQEVLDFLDLEELAERSPFALSGGQQQRVAIASVLAMRPKVLVLDEPTSQLDPRGTEEVFAALNNLSKRGGLTVVLVEYKLEWLAEFADRVIALSKGKIVLDDVPRKVLSSPTLISIRVGRTQYSEVAALISKRAAKSRGTALPVTLKETAAFLK